jgi:hypothetical protein
MASLKIPFVLSLSKDERARGQRRDTPFDGAAQASSGQTAIRYSY